VRLSLKAFWPDPERGLGLGFREVRYPSPLGPMPAWLVPGARADAWAIVVHGRGSERWEGLRMTRALHRAGLTTLLVAYRNDPGAPRTDGLARFGHAEAADVAAALAYAGASGARTVVLGGLSMGGGIAAALLTRPAPVPIACAILDSPLLDVADAIRERARRAPLAGPLRGLPDVITGAGLAIAARRFAIAWGEVDHLRAADALGVPALIWHGPEDPVVPSGPSRRLARLRPDLVELREPARAAHTDAWNLDPAAYESAIGDFLARRAPGLGGAP
jgi:pimeloyl-ACP methyl ester carboxylesterase